jgi:hypothetical protein
VLGEPGSAADGKVASRPVESIAGGISVTVLVAHPRRIRLAAIAGLAALLVSGCSSQPGAAASVAGAAISEQSVLDRTSAYLAESGATDTTTVGNSAVDMINRQQATDLIRHQLVLYAERERQITVAPSDVNTLISQQGGAAQLAQTWEVPSSEVSDLARDLLVLEKLLEDGKGSTFDDISVTADVLTFDSRDAAVAARTKYLAHPATMATDISAAGSSQGQLGAALQFSTQPGVASLGLYSVPAGSIVITPADSTHYLVVRVNTRSVKQTTLSADMLQALQGAPAQLSLASVALAPYAAQAGVTLNPRFGQWDPTTLQAVPGDDGL